MFRVPLPLILALQRSAMCFQSIELHVAPDGATSLGFVRGYKHFASPEQRILCPLRAFRAKPVRLLVIIALAIMILASAGSSGKTTAKEFDKTIALGNGYQAVMMGDLTCGSSETENEQLLFAQSSTGEKREYKIKTILLIKDLFYSSGLNVIFEK